MKKTLLPLGILLALSLFAGGCVSASRNTSSGGRETSYFGGLYTTETSSFQPVSPATINADTSKIVGKNGPSGKKVSLLWGLLTLHDY